MSDKNKYKNLSNESEDTEVVITGIGKSRSMISKLADITSMFIKKKDALPVSDNIDKSEDEFPTRMSHPLDQSSQMGRLDLSNKGHNFQITEIKIESEKLHEIPAFRNPANPRLNKVNSTSLIGRESGAESYTNVNFNIPRNASDSKEFAKKWRNIRRKLKPLMVVITVAIIFMLLRDEWIKYKKNSELIEMDAIEHNATNLKPIVPSARSNKSPENINYSISGRGLVYRCDKKKWFCLDAPNYRKCRINMKANNKTCISRAVLETADLCKKEIQLQQASPAPLGCE
ncbi:MAG: hypothetical protein QE271_01145 [Bacteriovoracaceae bacterium]|nr:hypothetical protein [Bacteriovoracaceae bacterium]